MHRAALKKNITAPQIVQARGDRWRLSDEIASSKELIY